MILLGHNAVFLFRVSREPLIWIVLGNWRFIELWSCFESLYKVGNVPNGDFPNSHW